MNTKIKPKLKTLVSIALSALALSSFSIAASAENAWDSDTGTLTVDLDSNCQLHSGVNEAISEFGVSNSQITKLVVTGGAGGTIYTTSTGNSGAERYNEWYADKLPNVTTLDLTEFEGSLGPKCFASTALTTVIMDSSTGFGVHSFSGIPGNLTLLMTGTTVPAGDYNTLAFAENTSFNLFETTVTVYAPYGLYGKSILGTVSDPFNTIFYSNFTSGFTPDSSSDVGSESLTLTLNSSTHEFYAYSNSSSNYNNGGSLVKITGDTSILADYADNAEVIDGYYLFPAIATPSIHYSSKCSIDTSTAGEYEFTVEYLNADGSSTSTTYTVNVTATPTADDVKNAIEDGGFDIDEGGTSYTYDGYAHSLFDVNDLDVIPWLHLQMNLARLLLLIVDVPMSLQVTVVCTKALVSIQFLPHQQIQAHTPYTSAVQEVRVTLQLIILL